MPFDEDALIGSIYEAGLMPALWPSALQLLANEFGAKGALLMFRAADVERWIASNELAPVMQAFVDQGWAEHNVRAARCRAAGSHPGFLTDLDVVSIEESENLPVYADFLNPRGLGAGVATVIPGIGSDGLMLTLEGFESHAAAKAAVPLLNRLRPHLARASAISGRMKLEQASAATAALAAIGTAAAVLTSGATVINANRLFIARIGTTFVERYNRLTIADPVSNNLFQQAMETVRRGLGQSIPIQQSDESRFVMHLLPSLHSAQDIFLSDSLLVVIDDLSSTTALDTGIIQKLYDLTPSEAKVANLLAQNYTIIDAARILAVSVETIRSHLKRTFSKTGVARQSDLLSRMRGMAIQSEAKKSDDL